MNKVEQLRQAEATLRAVLQGDENHRNWLAINEHEKAHSLGYHMLQESLRVNYTLTAEEKHTRLCQYDQVGQQRRQELRQIADAWVQGARDAYEANIVAITAA